jgi:hypothetical protein
MSQSKMIRHMSHRIFGECDLAVVPEAERDIARKIEELIIGIGNMLGSSGVSTTVKPFKYEPLKVSKDTDSIKKLTSMGDTLYRTAVYEIEVKYQNEKRKIRVPIKIPLLSDNNKFIINGGIYVPVIGIDRVLSASTGAHKAIRISSMMRNITLYNKSIEIKDYRGAKHTGPHIYTKMSKKSAPIMMFYFSEYGVRNTIKYMGYENDIALVKCDVEETQDVGFRYLMFPLFAIKGTGKQYAIRVDKEKFETNKVFKTIVTSMVAVAKEVPELTKDEIKDNDFWNTRLSKMGNSAGTLKSVDSTSIRRIVDVLGINNSIAEMAEKMGDKAPYNPVFDIFSLIRYIIYHYDTISSVRNKLRPHLFLTTYTTSSLMHKLTASCYRFLNQKTARTIERIIDIFKIPPDFIIESIVGSKNTDDNTRYTSQYNDMDFTHMLSFTKDNGSGAKVPDSKKALNLSDVGQLSLTHTSATAPGVSGNFVLRPKGFIDAKADQSRI